MLQVQLEIDSTVFHQRFNTNRIDIIAESVEQAIQYAATIDPDISIIMPEYMAPIKECTNYGDEIPTCERYFGLGKTFKGRQGQIFDGKRKLESGTMPWLCNTEIESITPLNSELNDNLSDLVIYMD